MRGVCRRQRNLASVADQMTAIAVTIIRAVTFPERSGRSVGSVAGAQPAARQAPASAEVTARRLRLAAIVLGALVLVLVGLSVPIGIAARQPFDGVVLAGVLAAVLGWLISRRQPGNRIGLLLVGFGALLVFYVPATRDKGIRKCPGRPPSSHQRSSPHRQNVYGRSPATAAATPNG